MKYQESYIPVSVAYLNIQVTTRSISLGMIGVFYVRPYARFIKIKINLRRKKLHKTNHGSNFLGGSFSNRDTQCKIPNPI